jgi:hypothetical protein
MSQAGLVTRGLLASIEELNYFASFHVRTSKFKVEGNSLRLPGDTISVIRVAIIRDGCAYLLGTSESLWNPTSDCGETFDGNADVGTINFYGYSHLNSYQEYYPVRMQQFPGYYRYIKDENRLVLGSGIEIGDELLIEYHTSSNSDSINLIPGIYKTTIMYHFLRAHYATRNQAKYLTMDRLFKESIKNIKISELPSLVDIMGVLQGQVTNRIR